MNPSSEATGSPSDQVVQVSVAVAVTDTPPAATMTETGGGLSTHSHVHRLTAIFDRSGSAPTVGFGDG